MLMMSALLLFAAVAVLDVYAATPADVNQVGQEISKQLLKSASASYPGIDFLPLVGNGPWPYYFANLGEHFVRSFNFVSQALGAEPDAAQYAAQGSYLALYTSVVNKLGFRLSSADEARYNAALHSSEAQLNALAGAYEASVRRLSAVGPARVDELLGAIGAWTASGTLTLADQQAIAGASAAALAQLFPNAPLQAGAVLPPLQRYLQAMADASDLLAGKSAAARNQALLKANSGANGPHSIPKASLADVYEDGQLRPAYAVTPANEIEKVLDSRAGSFTYTFSVVKESSSASTVEGDAGLRFSIPVVSWLVGSGGVGGGSKSSAAFADKSTTTVTMTFSGVGVGDIEPAAFDVTAGTGWFAPAILRDAEQRSGDVTGPVFIAPLTDAERTLMSAQKLIYSAEPAIRIEYKGAVSSDVEKQWNVQGGGGFTLFGLIRIGGSGSRQDSQENYMRTSTGFTYTYTPPVFSNQPMQDRTVFVVGAHAAPLFAAGDAARRTTLMLAAPPSEPIDAASETRLRGASLHCDASGLAVHAGSMQLEVEPTSVRLSGHACISGQLTVSSAKSSKLESAEPSEPSEQQVEMRSTTYCAKVTGDSTKLDVTGRACNDRFEHCESVRQTTHQQCTVLKGNARAAYRNAQPGCLGSTNSPCYAK